MEWRPCDNCGERFGKRARDSYKQWLKRKYCSKDCSNIATAKLKQIPLNKRFWGKVFIPKDETCCWIWTGAKDQHGYGSIGAGGRGGKRIKAHRLSYQINVGALSNALHILHICDNPSCVNPAHLRPGTQKDNMMDCARKGRINPKSLLNLRPGRKGYHGAGPVSNKELQNVSK